MAHPMMLESVWFEKYKADDAEKLYQENRAKEINGLVVQASASADSQSELANSGLAGQIARARQNIQNTLKSGVGLGIGVAVESSDLTARILALEKENTQLLKVTSNLEAQVKKLTARVDALDKTSSGSAPPAAPSKQEVSDDDDDDSVDSDMFDLDKDGDDKGYAKMVAERKAEPTKKPKKVVIAKSSIVLDVKPWDDETDMKEIEKIVRAVQCDGLIWGASKLVPVGYGIKKLQISCVVEDDKVGTDFLEEEITKHEDLIQSMDIAAFNKI